MHSVRELTEAGRALLHMVLVDASGFRAVYSESFDIRWPEDKDREIKRSFEIDGCRLSISQKLKRLRWRRQGTHYAYSLSGSGRYEAGGGSTSGGIEIVGPLTYRIEVRPHRPAGRNSLLSIQHPRASDRYHLLQFVTPAQRDDPLKEVATSELLASHGKEIHALLTNSDRVHLGIEHSLRHWTEMPRAVAIGGRLGFSYVLLMVGAVCLTLPFRSKPLLRVIVVTGVMVYAVGIDRICLNRRLAVLEDPEQPLELRLQACVNAGQTTFHHGAKQAAFDRVLSQEQVPFMLSERIRFEAMNWIEPHVYPEQEVPRRDVLEVLLKNRTPRNVRTLERIVEEHPLVVRVEETDMICMLRKETYGGSGDIRYEAQAFGGSRFGHHSGNNWPNRIEYLELRCSKDGLEVDFVLDDEISDHLGLQKEKVWTARLNRKEMYDALGVIRTMHVFHATEYENSELNRYRQQVFLLERAGAELDAVANDNG